MTKNWRIDNLTFGGLNAEEDKGLVSYFHRTSAYDRVLDPTIRFILGPKGSGKSALFQYVPKKAMFDDLRDELVIPISFPDLALYADHLSHMLGEEQKPDILWQFLIAIVTCASLGTLSLRPESAALLEFVNRWTSDRPSCLQQLLSVVPTIEALSVKITPRAGGTRPLRHTEINDALSLADDILRQEGREAWVFIDKLDETADQFDNPQAILQALMRCQSALSRYGGLRLKMFLRDDIYDDLPYVNKDHFSNQVIYLDWEPQDLMIMLAARVLASFDSLVEMPKIEQALSVISTIMDPVPSGDLSGYITASLSDARGFTSPRDVINFAEHAVRRQRLLNKRGESAAKVGMISCAAMEYAMDEASKSKLSDFVYGAFPEVSKMLEPLRGAGTSVFSSTQLQTLIGIDSKTDFLVVIQKLNRIGVIGPVGNVALTTAKDYKVGTIYHRALNLVS